MMSMLRKDFDILKAALTFHISAIMFAGDQYERCSFVAASTAKLEKPKSLH